MLTLIALALATPQVCTEQTRTCRACTTRLGKPVCSTIGIACQPKLRRCTPKAPVAGKSKSVSGHEIARSHGRAGA
jgi:hypothetical protein